VLLTRVTPLLSEHESPLSPSPERDDQGPKSERHGLHEREPDEPRLASNGPSSRNPHRIPSNDETQLHSACSARVFPRFSPPPTTLPSPPPGARPTCPGQHPTPRLLTGSPEDPGAGRTCAKRLPVRPALAPRPSAAGPQAGALPSRAAWAPHLLPQACCGLGEVARVQARQLLSLHTRHTAPSSPEDEGSSQPPALAPHQCSRYSCSPHLPRNRGGRGGRERTRTADLESRKHYVHLQLFSLPQLHRAPWGRHRE